MAALPYIQLYIADYQADTAHLTLEQKGAYMELIMNYWQTEKPLNNSDDRLASVLKISKRRFQTMKKLLAEFFTVEGDIWTHGRIESDLESVLKKSRKASYAASEGARKRANDRLRTLSVRSANAGHIDIDKDIDKDNRQKEKDIAQPKVERSTPDISFDEFWKIYPRKVGKGQARKAFKAALKKTTLEVILAGVETMKADPLLESEFTPHPATWLNGERWLDDPQPKVKGKAGLKLAPTPIPEPFKAISRPDVVPMPTNIREIALKGATR